MVEQKSVGITACSVLLAVCSAFGFIIVFGGAMSKGSTNATLLFFLIPLALAISSYGLKKRKTWGRYSAIIFASLIAFLLLIENRDIFTQTFKGPFDFNVLFGLVMFLAVEGSLFGCAYYLIRPKVKDQFN
jgi:drug/metabolite transporter (DMT)-like permease